MSHWKLRSILQIAAAGAALTAWVGCSGVNFGAPSAQGKASSLGDSSSSSSNSSTSSSSDGPVNPGTPDLNGGAVIPPNINDGQDVLARNAACAGATADFLAPKAANVQAQNLFLTVFNQGNLSYADVGNLSVIQVHIDEPQSALYVDNAANLDILAQSGGDICLGIHQLSGIDAQNMARHLTLVNRGTAPISIALIAQEMSQEFHLFGFDVGSIIQQQKADLAILYNSNVGRIIQNAGAILIKNPSKPVDLVLQNSGQVEVDNGQISAIQQQLAGGTIIVDGGSVGQIDSQSCGTLILKNGATAPAVGSGSCLKVVNQ